MAQPETAARGEELPSPAEETFNKMAERLLNEEPEEEEEDKEEDESAPSEGAEEGEDLDLSEDEEEHDELAPPVSLTAEEKEIFKSLPEEAKRFTTRRIGELERAFHAKAQEVANVKETTQMEYLRYAEGLQQETVARLNHYAEQLKPQVPDARLARTDPAAYAHMLSTYHEANAQREQAQREATAAEQQRQAYEAEIVRREAQTQSLRLQSELPELFDPAIGQELAKELAATAQALGFDPAQISDVDAIKALKVTSEWKTKAEKYDRAMSKKGVTKKPTPTAKPGTPQGSGSKGRKVDAAWKLAREARKGADQDAALAIWAERAGYI